MPKRVELNARSLADQEDRNDQWYRSSQSCPVCHSDEIYWTSSGPDGHGDHIFIATTCHHCGAHWQEAYELEGVCDIAEVDNDGGPMLANFERDRLLDCTKPMRYTDVPIDQEALNESVDNWPRVIEVARK